MLTLRKLFAKQGQLYRTFASSSKLVDLSHDNQTGVTTVSMARAPVNSLNTELLTALNTSLSDAKKNGSKGIILTSSMPTVFSAGLDLMEMYNRTESQLTEFWSTLQNTWLALYSSDIPIAAAINGASPAGGCLLAISCEYRVFVEGKHTIGLNETQLGIVAPKWFSDVYIATLGYRHAELALTRGSMFHPEEALKLGLVDQLATDKADAIEKCQKYISSFKKVPPQARALTKLSVRKPILNWLKENLHQDQKEFVKFIQLPPIQTGLKMYLEALKQKQ